MTRNAAPVVIGGKYLPLNPFAVTVDRKVSISCCCPQVPRLNQFRGVAVVVSGSETEAPSFSDLTKVNSDFKCILLSTYARIRNGVTGTQNS
jgi:hypothetical protein